MRVTQIGNFLYSVVDTHVLRSIWEEAADVLNSGASTPKQA